MCYVKKKSLEEGEWKKTNKLCTGMLISLAGLSVSLVGLSVSFIHTVAQLIELISMCSSTLSLHGTVYVHIAQLCRMCICYDSSD